jgi:phage FluMu gp28-like protein
LELLDPELDHCLGEDFARSGDLTVLPIGEIERNLTRKARFIVELRNIPFAQQRQIVWYILDRLPRFRSSAFDSRGNGQQLAEETADRYGRGRVEMVMLTDRWYAEEFPAFKAAFEDKTIVVPRDTDIKNDLRAVQVIGGTPKIPKTTGQGKKGERRHGDAAIALLMMWYASCRDWVEIDYQQAPAQYLRWDAKPDDQDRDDHNYVDGKGGAW